VDLGRPQGLDGPLGLAGVGRAEQLVGDDRDAARLAGLQGQDVPLRRSGARWVGGELLDVAQVVLGAVVILRVVAGQQHAGRRQLAPVPPHDLLQERGPGLGLADVDDDPGPCWGVLASRDVMGGQADTSRIVAVLAGGSFELFTRRSTKYNITP
jgi:hypothetical protein